MQPYITHLEQTTKVTDTEIKTERETDEETGHVRMLNFTMIYILIKESNDEITLNIQCLTKTLIGWGRHFRWSVAALIRKHYNKKT